LSIYTFDTDFRNNNSYDEELLNRGRDLRATQFIGEVKRDESGEHFKSYKALLGRLGLVYANEVDGEMLANMATQLDSSILGLDHSGVSKTFTSEIVAGKSSGFTEAKLWDKARHVIDTNISVLPDLRAFKADKSDDTRYYQGLWLKSQETWEQEVCDDPVGCNGYECMGPHYTEERSRPVAEKVYRHVGTPDALDTITQPIEVEHMIDLSIIPAQSNTDSADQILSSQEAENLSDYIELSGDKDIIALMLKISDEYHRSLEQINRHTYPSRVRNANTYRSSGSYSYSINTNVLDKLVYLEMAWRKTVFEINTRHNIDKKA